MRTGSGSRVPGVGVLHAAFWRNDSEVLSFQGKEEFEKNQKQLLEKGNIIRQKTALELQQVRDRGLECSFHTVKLTGGSGRTARLLWCCSCSMNLCVCCLKMKQFERLEQEVSRPINNDMTNWVPAAGPQPPHNGPGDPAASKLCAGDRQLLLFYQEQCEQNVTTVTNAIDAFFTSVNANQPPKIFVAHSKFVILSAHKLVFIGDTLSRQARAPEVRSRVAQSSNALCDKLKDIVSSTKTAALQYPAAGAAREMTQRVKELGGCTQHFRTVLGQLLLM